MKAVIQQTKSSSSYAAVLLANFTQICFDLWKFRG